MDLKKMQLLAYSSHFSLYSQFTPVTAVVKNAMFLPLSFYMPPQGFEEDETYTDSRALFEGLWQEWLEKEVFT